MCKACMGQLLHSIDGCVLQAHSGREGCRLVSSRDPQKEVVLRLECASDREIRVRRMHCQSLALEAAGCRHATCNLVQQSMSAV